MPPVDRTALYWTCRVALVTDRAQLPVFDAVFSAVFDGRLDPADSRGDPNAPPAVGSEDRARAVPPDRRPSGTAGDDPECDAARRRLRVATTGSRRSASGR